MVSAGLAAPVVKSLEDTEAAQSAPKPRPSVTPTVPRGEEMVVPGAPEPRAALAGAVIDSGPVMTAVVTAHGGMSVPGGQVLPGAAEVTVLARLVPPVSGLSTGTEEGMGGGRAGAG